MNIWEVRPFADQISHDDGPDCVCGPRVEEHAAGAIVVHHSLDGREVRVG